MSELKIDAHIAVHVIKAEKHHHRFELFCNKLVGLHEGGVLVYSTSSTRDLGRDGRGDSFASGLYVCASLEKDVTPKACSDVDRLVENASAISRVYFCSSQELTEERVEGIKGVLLDRLPATAVVEVLGAQQLADLAARHPDAYFECYRRETEEFLGALKGLRDTSSAARALELALATIGNANSSAIRVQVYRDAARSALAAEAKNAAECATAVSHAFRLPRVISKDAVAVHLRQMLAVGEIIESNGRFSLTPIGHEKLREQQTRSEESLLAGRSLVRERIEAELGYLLSDDQYTRIWNLVQEEITRFFYSRGLAFVAMMSRIIRGDAPPEDRSVQRFARELANSVSKSSGLPEQQEELRTAIVDLFEQPVGAASDWLVGLCSGYIILCSLGLEAESGAVVAESLRRMRLVLDADVVLSLLSEGEPNHEGIAAVVHRWVQLGGRVMVAEEVVHEVAYHAQIAQFDFENVRSWLPGTAADRLSLIENAFVRGFAHLMATRGTRISQWRSYIEQFRARGRRGEARIVALLSEEYGVEGLPSDLPVDRGLKKRVTESLMGTHPVAAHAVDEKKVRDRAERDSSLYCKLVALIDRAETSEPGVSYFLMSSSRRLARVEAMFRAVEEDNFIINVSGMLYLLTLVPEVSMGMGSMRAFLFEGAKVAFSGGIERTILRVIHESREFELSPAKRGALMRQFRSRLVEFAADAGLESTGELEEEIGRGEHQELTASLLRNALDDVAVEAKIRRENRELREENTRLQRELAEVRRASIGSRRGTRSPSRK